MVHRQMVEAADAGNLLDQVGGPVYVAAPGWRGYVEAAIGRRHCEAEGFENALLLGRVDLHARQAFHLAGPEEDAAFPVDARAHGHRHRGFAAANLRHHAGDMAGGPDRAFGIKPALEPVAGVGIQVQLAPGGRHRNRVEHRDLEEHAGGAVAHAGALAAHHTSQIIDTFGIADCDHAGFHLVGLLVQSGERLAAIRLPHDQLTAVNLVDVIGMQRATQIEHHIVGDVDKGADRALADGVQAPRHPVRARPVGDAAKGDAGDQRGQMLGPVKIEPPGDRAVEAAFMRAGVQRLQRAVAGSGQIARDAANAEAIGAVRGDGDLDDRIIQTGPGGEALADRRVLIQIDNAVMLVRDHHLALRAEHAVRVLAADVAGLQHQIDAGHIGAGRGEDALHAGARVRRAADNLHRITAAGIHHADAQPVGIGMLLGGDHLGDGEGG